MYITNSSFFGLGKEGTRGTAQAASLYLPCEVPTTDPKKNWLPDGGLRGSPVENYGNVEGIQWNEVGVKGNVFADTIPMLLQALLGGADAKTGSGPYTHVIGLLNSPSTGSQPPSYTLYDYDGTDHCRRMVAGQMDSLTIAGGADAATTWDSKWFANLQTDVSPPTEAFSDEQFVPGWDTVISIGGTPSAVAASWEFAMTRNTTPVHTGGSANPYRLFAGPLGVMGKLTLVYESGDATLANGLTWDKQAVQMLSTNPENGGTHSLALLMTQCQFENPKINRGKTYVEVDVEVHAEANTTDAISTGYSPIKSTTINAISTAF